MDDVRAGEADGRSAVPEAALPPGGVSGSPTLTAGRKPAISDPGGTDGWRAGLRRVPGWALALIVYLALSLFMWWHVWTGGHAASMMLCNCGDPSSFVSFIEWPAYALTHGQSLLLAHSEQVPTGLNMLDNTSVLALGVVLTPVTWLFGPVASLNVALTAAPVLSGISAYGCLRRALGVWWPAAFVAGLLFGFSPFMQRNETIAHLQVSFLPLVPLILLCCYELIVTQRGKAWRWGLLLGLLVAVQFFIGSEILTLVTLTVAGSVAVTVIVAVIFRRQALVARLPFAVTGIGIGGLVGAALLAYPVWFAMDGPDHISGSDWARVTTNSLDRIFFAWRQAQVSIVRLPDAGYLGTAGVANAYLGIVAILVVIAAAVVVRRPLTSLCVVILVFASWASLGTYHQLAAFNGMLSFVPSLWRVVKDVPVLDQVTPQNFSAIMVSAVVISAALLLDWIWRHRSGSWLQRLPARLPRPAISAGVAAVLSLALIVPWMQAWPMPFKVISVTTPTPVERILSSLPAHAVVLFYPFPSSELDQALIWQARDNLQFSLAGGRGITAGPGGAAVHGLEAGTPAGMLSALSTSYEPYGTLALPPMPTAAVQASMRAALRSWQVTNIVMSGGGRAPDYSRQWLTQVLGTPPHLQDGRYVWTNVQALVAS